MLQFFTHTFFVLNDGDANHRLFHMEHLFDDLMDLGELPTWIFELLGVGATPESFVLQAWSDYRSRS
jgi:hypothetical protein